MDFTSDSASLLTRLQHRLHPDSTLEGMISPPDDDLDYSSSVSSTIQPRTPEIHKNDSIDLRNEDAFPALPASNSTKLPSTIWNTSNGVDPNKKIIGAAAATSVAKASLTTTERFVIPPEALAKPQNQLGSKSLAPGDICRNIMVRTGTIIELSTAAKSGKMTIIITGPADSVKKARREVQNSLCVRVTATINVPPSVRRYIFGTGGKNLQSLTSRTMTNIQIPKLIPDADGNEPEEQPVTITGDFEAVEVAKKEIEAIVEARTSKATIRLPVDKSYHPFIAGPNNSTLQRIMLETGVRIHIPPFLSNRDSDSKTNDDIIIVGDKEPVAVAEAEIMDLYNQAKRSTRTLALPVNKRLHRFIIGPKGSVLNEILAQTGCYVELPAADDTSDVVTIRGPDNTLSAALSLVVEKANTMAIEDIEINPLLKPKVDPNIFVRYMFTKHKSAIKTIESTYNVSINRTTNLSDHLCLEIQAKSKSTCDGAKNDLLSLLREHSEVFFETVEIPRGLHRYIIGKGGANISKVKLMDEWKGKLIDIIVPNEADESDDVIIVLGYPSSNSIDKSTLDLIFLIKEKLMSLATSLADLDTKTISVDYKYHGRLIGHGGERLKEILHGFNNTVVVKFPEQKDKTKSESLASPSADSNSSLVTIKGPSKDVAKVSEKISALVSEWKHLDIMNSFEKRVKVPKGVGQKIMSGGGQENSGGIGWLIAAVRDSLAAKDKNRNTHEKEQPGHLGVKVELEEFPQDQDVIRIVGAKNIIDVAGSIIEERAVKLAEMIATSVNIFEEVSEPARTEICQAPEETKNKVIRRIIGKDGKVVKRLSSKHSVHLQFASKDSDEKEEENVVVIKGAKNDVASAKTELLELVAYEIMHASCLEFMIHRTYLPQIVGRGGSRVSKMKEEFDVRIDFLDDFDHDGDSTIRVLVEGSKESCENVRTRILETIDELVNTESLELKIPHFLHRHIIGPSGSRIQAIIEGFGGSDKVKIQFPQSRGDDSEPNEIVTLKAHQSILPKLKAEVEKLVDITYAGEKINPEGVKPIEEKFSIPKSEVPRIVYRGGTGLKELMDKFSVTIWINADEGEETPEGIMSTVRIVGAPGDEQKLKDAKSEIISKLRSVGTLSLPQLISDRLKEGGAIGTAETTSLQELFKRIRSEHAAYPEISPSKTDIIVRGEKKNVDIALNTLKKDLDLLITLSHVITITTKSVFRPHIIGRGGFTIERIRTETGCLIEIIRGSHQSSEDTITIRGTEQSVAQAKSVIEGIIRQQEEHVLRDLQRQEEAAKAEEVSRIDDSTTSIHSTGTSQHRHIPGYSAKSRQTKPSIPLVFNPQDSSPSAYASNAKDNNGWKSVKSRGGKKDEMGEEVTESLTTSSKKKKNKKTSIEKGSDNIGTNFVEEKIETKSEKNEVEEIKTKLEQTVVSGKIEKKVEKVIQKTPVVEAKKPESTKVEKIENRPYEEPKLEEEEWKTVEVTNKKTTKSLSKNVQNSSLSQLASQSVFAAAAALGIDESAKKKKKKKKKKPKNDEESND